MKIKIITDSTSNLTEKLAIKYDIHIIPTFVIADEKEIVDDGNLDYLKLYDIIDESKSAKTSLPSPSFVFDALEAHKNYDHLLIIHVGSKLSGTINATKGIVKQFSRRNPEGPKITVYDSKGASFTLGTIAIKAAQMVKEGLKIEKIIERLDDFRDKDVKVWLTVPDLKRLFDGGRVSRTQYFLSDLLHAYPILTLVDGSLQPVGKDIGFDRTIKKLVSIVQDYYEEEDKVFIWFANTRPREENDRFRKYVKNIVEPKVIGFEDFFVGPVITCHTGTSVCGIITARNFNLEN